MCRWLFRSDFVYDPERAESVMSLNEREAIKDRPLLVKSLAVLALVVAAFVLHPVLHYEPSVVALLGAGLLVLITNVTIGDALADVEWPTLAFFAGLFIMVGGLVETGVIGDLRARWPTPPTAGWAWPPCPAVRVGRAVRDHRQHPVRRHDEPGRGRPGGRGRRDDGQVLWWALALGADLGGNATAIGASANVVDARPGRARRAPHRLLGVHQVRPGRHRGHGRPMRAVHLAALPLSRAARAGRVRMLYAVTMRQTVT